jgi:multimeric flavodoxin WrbA
MRLLGISGSNRREGNSYLLLEEMFKGLSSIDSKTIQVAEMDIKPCELCFELCSAKPFECAIHDDLHKLIEEMKFSDGIIFVCPFYFYIPSKFQAFLERVSCLDYFTEERHGGGQPPSGQTVSPNSRFCLGQQFQRLSDPLPSTRVCPDAPNEARARVKR